MRNRTRSYEVCHGESFAGRLFVPAVPHYSDWTFSALLAAASSSKDRKASAKCVIFLHQWGGPGQHETFDYEADAPDNVRGWYKPMSSVVPLTGLRKLPRIAS
ncbi:MAG: hypothetical protein U0798_08885 [Gemmataceae bacterium]